MANNRIDDIMLEVQAEIERKRATGELPADYLFDIEDAHNKELGKESRRGSEIAQTVNDLTCQLREKVDRLSSIERDTAKFPPWRFVRELAMSRHQLIRLNQEVRDLAITIEHLNTAIARVVEYEHQILHEKNNIALRMMYERTLLLDKLVVLNREFESRLQKLETQ